jgi:hypothetical protein
MMQWLNHPPDSSNSKQLKASMQVHFQVDRHATPQRERNLNRQSRQGA